MTYRCELTLGFASSVGMSLCLPSSQLPMVLIIVSNNNINNIINLKNDTNSGNFSVKLKKY